MFSPISVLIYHAFSHFIFIAIHNIGRLSREIEAGAKHIMYLNLDMPKDKCIFCSLMKDICDLNQFDMEF